MAKDVALADMIRAKPAEKVLEEIENLSDEATLQLLYDWEFWARPKQKIPGGKWHIWLVRTGRGFGKTRMAAETVRHWVEKDGVRRINLVGETPGDVRDTMIEGESGLLSVCPPWNKPKYETSKRRVTWDNGATALIFSGANPEQLRGPQCEKAWVDELAVFKYPRETWDNLMFGLRLGNNPQVIATTTPKPISLLKEIRMTPGTVLTTGSTYENKPNLTPIFFSDVISKYEGTNKGGQEIYGLELAESPGALWNRTMIETSRVQEVPLLVRVGVGIDPAVTSNRESAETGIIIAGIGEDGDAYVLADRSGRRSPLEWAQFAINGYYEFDADVLVGEVNNGGDLIETTIRTVDKVVNYKSVHASKGKYTRAEPVASLYEQGKIHHVGVFPDLEDQMCTWEPGEDSPDRMDALVWILWELMLSESRIRSPMVRSLRMTSEDIMVLEDSRPRLTELQKFLLGG